MYNQNEWHDNPLTIICRDLDIHVRNSSHSSIIDLVFFVQVPTPEQLMELKLTRDALKAEYDALRQSVNN
jgi:hypothetical protein